MSQNFYNISLITCLPLIIFYLLLIYFRTDLFVYYQNPFDKNEEEDLKKKIKIEINYNNLWLFMMIVFCLAFAPIINYVVVFNLYASLIRTIKNNNNL